MFRTVKNQLLTLPTWDRGNGGCGVKFRVLIISAACCLFTMGSVSGIGGADPANACSFSWGKGYSPKQIPRRLDVWKVKGHFTPVDAKTGADLGVGDEFYLTEDTGEMLGRIDRKHHKPVLTKQYYLEDWMIDCGMLKVPQWPESGTFWLEKKRDRQGRYRVLLWEPAKEKQIEGQN